jgi:hypothetical protein
VRYARAVSARYNALSPLAHLFDEIEYRQSVKGKISP